MESTDRVGILQTYNQRGENCRVVIKLSDLDEGFRHLVNQYIPLLERCTVLADKLRDLRDIVNVDEAKLIDELLGDSDEDK